MVETQLSECPFQAWLHQHARTPGISHNNIACISLETRRSQTQQAGVFRHKTQLTVTQFSFPASPSQPPTPIAPDPATSPGPKPWVFTSSALAGLRLASPSCRAPAWGGSYPVLSAFPVRIIRPPLCTDCDSHRDFTRRFMSC